MGNLTDLFTPISTTELTTTSQRDPDLYRVSYKDKKCTGGQYKSIIRFVPNINDTAHYIMSKNVHYVINPITNEGRYLDNIHERNGQKSPITEMFFNFLNTKIPTFMDHGKKTLSTKTQYSALVQVIKDEQHPEYVGQIKVFTFGKTIYEKISQEEHPTVGVGVHPFNPIGGRYFSLVCEAKSGFPNYDKSMFINNQDDRGNILPSGMWYLNPTTNQMEFLTENSDRDAFASYLQTSSPDLSKYGYHEWTEDDYKFVENVLNINREYLSTGRLPAPAAPAPVAPTAGIQFNNAPVFPGATMPAAPAQAPVAPAPVMGGFASPQTPPTPASPQTPSFGGFPAGVPTPPTMGTTGVAAPTVSPAQAPSAPQMGGFGVGASIDDVINSL